MGYIVVAALYVLAFSPALALFVKFIAPDPLRSILFVLGAFFWLVALMLSALVWLLLKTVFGDFPVLVAALCSALIQEAARVGYFLLLKRAQSGLNKLTKAGTKAPAAVVSNLQNARHMLALVCGLGMGVMASLFLTMNIFAEFSGPGIVGLPRALKEEKREPSSGGAYVPVYFAISASILCVAHITWTIQIWDACHMMKLRPIRAVSGAIALVSHVIFILLSSQASGGYRVFCILGELVILLASIIYSYYLLGGSVASLRQGIVDTAKDWGTLRFIRERIGVFREKLQSRAQRVPTEDNQEPRTSS